MRCIRCVAFAFVFGCGSVPGNPDAFIDIDAAPIIDADPYGDVTVTTYSRAVPGVVAGIDIVAIDPDGTLNTALTDGNGQATLRIFRGASVTAIYRTADGGYVFTFLGVEPGDSLQFGDQIQPPSAPAGTMTATFPPVPGATDYRIYHSCGSDSGAASPITLTQTTDCHVAQQDFHYYAFDNNGLLQFGTSKNIPWMSGGNTSLATWQAAGSFTLGVMNIPPSVTSVQLEAHVIANGGPTVNSFFISGSGMPAGGSFSVTRPWGPGGDGVLGLFGAFEPDATQLSSRRLPANATQFQIAEPLKVPMLISVESDPAARSVTFTQRGTQPYDAATVAISYSRMAPARSYQWQLVVPPGSDGTNEVVLPDLPPTLDEFEPLAGDTISGGGFLWEFLSVDSHVEIRARPEWMLATNFSTYVRVLVGEEASFSLFGI